MSTTLTARQALPRDTVLVSVLAGMLALGVVFMLAATAGTGAKRVAVTSPVDTAPVMICTMANVPCEMLAP